MTDSPYDGKRRCAGRQPFHGRRDDRGREEDQEREDEPKEGGEEDLHRSMCQMVYSRRRMSWPRRRKYLKKKKA